jgi:hypothetical protein
MKARYRSRPTATARRRSPAQMEHLLASVQAIVTETEITLPDNPQITVRHLFYRLVARGVIEKTEGEYKSLVGHLSRWRRAELVPWSAFADSTRWHIRHETFDGVQDALTRTRETYRRDMWSTQPHYAELWLEKDAIAAIVSDVAVEFGVPVFVCRGFASLSSLYGAAQTFKDATASGKRVAIFHLGDFDPSGHAAADAIERTLTEDFGCAIAFKRLAVTRQQIRRLKLPTRPTKETDSRARDWTGGACVELDAMPPEKLREIVEMAITNLIDPYAWSQLVRVEDEEKAALEKICAMI